MLVIGFVLNKLEILKFKKKIWKKKRIVSGELHLIKVKDESFQGLLYSLGYCFFECSD